MGKKTNANIIQLSTNPKKKYSSTYVEKTTDEKSAFIFKDNEIRQFIDRFFKLHGLFIHNIQVKYLNKSVCFLISYYISKKTEWLMKSEKLKKIIRIKRIRVQINKKTRRDFRKAKRANIKATRFVRIIKAIPKIIRRIKYKIIKTRIKSNYKKNFSEYLLESLNLYTQKTKTIQIILQNLNKGLSLKFNALESKQFKQFTLNLRKFSKTTFFKEAVNIVTIAVMKKNSAKFLADYIALQLWLNRKHNFFLKFLKTSLILLLKTKFKKINGIKIEIKGRINGRRRSNKRIIKLGRISLRSFQTNINYYHSISYTKNGTLGIKVWINQ
uniref:Ribosomal protein S3 n=1 Tax=Toxarium undulatum TaxID=210620 RepID=A0A2U9GI54_9STRA|nr:ribosomal protein S3 [Toxarium undulatum]AWQ64139.1 ribosomal protein S3 [Toxarium undulatum]